jgi:hypothetical protein
VIENHTSTTKVLIRGCRVDGFYAITLRGPDGRLQPVAFSLVGCIPEQEMVAKPGTTVHRFKLPARYSECTGSAKDEPAKSSKYWVPLCLKDPKGQRDIFPPLPPGNYTVVLVPAGKWDGPHVKPAALVLTSAN